MPPRSSARSTRPSTTSTKATGAASTRRSTRAVAIPEEGPETSLRTEVAQIFGDAQKTTTTQRKLVVNLRKIQEACCIEQQQTKKGKNVMIDAHEDFDQDDFNEEITRCMLRILGVKKGESVGDRLVRFLGLFLKHASEKDAATISPDEEGPTVSLIAHVLTTTIGFLDAKDKTIRFRATQMIAHIMNSLDVIDDDMFDLLRLGLMKRLRDKEPSVRVQAVFCLVRLASSDDDEEDDEDSEDDTTGSILDKLLHILVHDPSAEVRRAVLNNLPLDPVTLKYIFERARDMDPTARRTVYNKILPKLGDFRHMSVVQREKLIRWGLRDRDDMVRKHTARLFTQQWLDSCAAPRGTLPKEEKAAGELSPPSMDALCELLERIDLMRNGDEEGVAHEAMRVLWEGRPDYLEYVTFDHEFWNNLDANKAFVVRTLNDYCQSVQDDRLHDELEDKMPDMPALTFIIQRELNKLIEMVTTLAAMDEDDPEAGTAQEDEEESEFVVQQLLNIALTLDYKDEGGRVQMYNLMREVLARPQLPEECTKLAVEVLRAVCGTRGESEFCALMLEAINEIRDAVHDDPEVDVDSSEEGKESFHSARSAVEEADAFIRPAKRAKTGKEVDPEEEAERYNQQNAVYLKCLHIVQIMLQNVHCELESNNSLVTIERDLIVPACKDHNTDVRTRGLICLGLATLLSKDSAAKNLDVFLQCTKVGNEEIKEIAIEALTDICITHPQFLAPPAVDPNASTEDAEPKLNPLARLMTKILIKNFNSNHKRISLIACTAASKLLLMGMLPPALTAEILKTFTLTYFDPDSKANPALRQQLTYFLPVFCHSKIKNTALMTQAAVPVISKLLLIRDETVEEEVDEMVGWPLITAHLAEWTDGRKVVGASTTGSDGKIRVATEAEKSHILLGIEILERALTTTCSKDERKPLLMLLAKLQLIPSSTKAHGDELQELQGLVVEAVEGRLGTDATQKNFLAKLEAGLTKHVGELERVSPTPTPGQEGDEDEEGEESDATVTQGRTGNAKDEAGEEVEASVEPEAAEAQSRRSSAASSVARSSVARSSVARSSVARSSVARSSVARESVARESVPRESVPRSSVARSSVARSSVAPTEAEDDEDVEMEDDDTMFAGMQGEGTRMPLELDDDDDDDDDDEDEDEEEEEAEESTVVSDTRKRPRGVAETELDIIEDLLESDMSE